MKRTLLRDERGGILATVHIQDNGDVIIYDKIFITKGDIFLKMISLLTRMEDMLEGVTLQVHL